MGVHIFTRCHLTQYSLLLLVLQPLCHGDDGHAGALPVSLLYACVLNARHYNTVTRTTLKHSSNSETEIKRICSMHGDTVALTGRVYILLDSGIV